MSRPKKNQLTDLNQVHGRLPNQPEAQASSKPWGGATSLDDICGRQVSSKYKQKTVEEYSDLLASYDVADLRAEAGRIGLIPSPDARTLKRNLLDRFIEASVPYSPMTPRNQKDKNILPVELRNRMGGE